MSIFNSRGKKSLGLAVLAAALLFPAIANAEFDPADVQTTTRFGHAPFGTALDGRIFEGDPLIGLEVVETRIFWDIVVADKQDAADILADVYLPIDTNSGLASGIILDGVALGWSGSGTFNHEETTDRYNGFFSQAGTGFGAQASGLPFDTVEVLSTSRIEIDYLVSSVPEPSTITLLLLGLGCVGVFCKRRGA